MHGIESRITRKYDFKNIISKMHQRVAEMKKLALEPFHLCPFIEMSGYQKGVVHMNIL